MLPGSSNITHVLRFGGDVFLQLYVFKQVPDDTRNKFLRRCMCRILSTVIVMIVVSTMLTDQRITDVVWDLLLISTVVVLIRFQRMPDKVEM